MLKFILVIIIPAPNQFGLLVIISFACICFGGISYAIYSRKVRGHLFHFDKLKCNNNVSRPAPRPTALTETKHADEIA